MRYCKKRRHDSNELSARKGEGRIKLNKSKTRVQYYLFFYDQQFLVVICSNKPRDSPCLCVVLHSNRQIRGFLDKQLHLRMTFFLISMKRKFTIAQVYLMALLTLIVGKELENCCLLNMNSKK